MQPDSPTPVALDPPLANPREMRDTTVADARSSGESSQPDLAQLEVLADPSGPRIVQLLEQILAELQAVSRRADRWDVGGLPPPRL